MATKQTTYTSEFSYTGGLDSDSFYSKVAKGDTLPQNGLGCYNISTINTNGQNDGSVFGINGNALSFNLPIITTQNKIYTFSITEPASGTFTYSINFLNINYTLIANVTLLTTGTLTTDANTLSSSISSALSFYGVSISHTISGGVATFKLEFTGLLGFDWLMVDNTVLTIKDSGNSFTGFSVGDVITDQTTNELLGTILSVSTGILILQNTTGNNIGSTTDVLVNQASTTVSLSAGVGYYSTPANPVIIQEAIDRGLTDFNGGYCLPIGGIDYLGDLFIFSTCQGNSPQSYPIIGVVNVGGAIAIKIAGNYNTVFTAGNSINVGGVNGVSANGTWSVGTVSVAGGVTTITLYGTSFSGTYTSGGIVSIYNEGFLNISVHQKDLTLGTWTNTSLLSTKALNNRFYNPLRKEIVANMNNNILAIYFIDGNDFDRIFEYTGTYLANGAIEYYNPSGLYTYDSILFSTRDLLNTPTSIATVSSVVDTGGEILSGNWRYTGVPRSSDLTAGQIGLLSNTINIYNGYFSQPSNIMGTPGTKSSMQVTVQFTDIPENVYSYMDLIGVYYTGGTETVYFIKQIPIPANTTELSITHTGLEDYTAYTSGFVYSSLGYICSKAQTTCSNTLVKANLIAQQISNFTSFFQQWTHSLQRGTNLLQPTGDDRTGYTLGEYQIPLATSEYVSAMLNETYRIGGVVELVSGVFTPVFWIDDIRFDLGATNVANPFNNNRRVGNSITNYDLSESPANTATNLINSYVFYLMLYPPIGWQDYLIDGVPLSQSVKRIHIFRVDNNVAGLNEVLSSGLIVRHYAGTIGGGSTFVIGNSGGSANQLFENPFLVTDLGAGSLLSFIPQINNTFNTWNALFNSSGSCLYGLVGGGVTANTAYSCSFYSPDWIYGQADISYSNNDTLLCYGTPDWNTGLLTTINMDTTSVGTIPSNTSTNYWGTEIRLSGSTGINFDAFNSNLVNLGLYGSPNAINIPDFAGIVSGQGGLQYFSDIHVSVGSPSADQFIYDTPHKIWLYTARNLSSLTTYQASASSYYGIYLTGSSGSAWVVGDMVTDSNGSTATISAIAGDLLDPSFSLIVNNASFAVGHTTFSGVLTDSVSSDTANVGIVVVLNIKNPDIGLYYGQYYRNLGSVTASTNSASYPNNTKFGAITEGTYIPTGAYLDVTNTSNNVTVFGWDSFTQKSFLKLRYPTNTNSTYEYNSGGGVTCVFFCQNRMNFNMRDPGNLAYPQTPPIDAWINWPEEIPTGSAVEIDNYDVGYTPRNPDCELNAYNPEVPYISVLHERIIYSLVQPQNSTSNNWQVFPPLNFYDLSSDKGYVCNIFTIQGELFTLQQKSLLRQFFNEVGSLNVGEASTPTQVTLGSGSPFTKPSNAVLPNIGNSNNLGFLYGVEPVTGRDMFAWLDVISKQVLLLKSNGSVEVISLTKKMRTWFEQWLGLVSSDNPNLKNGITGVWDDKRKQFIWTICAITDDAEEYLNSTNYNVNQLVTVGFVGMEGFRQVYKSLVNNNKGNNPATSPFNWQAVTNTQALLITQTSNNFNVFSQGDIITDTTQNQRLGTVLQTTNLTLLLSLDNTVVQYQAGDTLTNQNNVSVTTSPISTLLITQQGAGFNIFNIGDTILNGASFDGSFDNSFEQGTGLLGTVLQSTPNTLLLAYTGNTFTAGQSLVNQTLKNITTTTAANTIINVSNNNTINVITVNPLVYNYFTIVYNTLVDRFHSFLAPRPYFYAEWSNTYLTAYPNTNKNSIWEDDIGTPLNWYGGTLQKTGYLTYPVNDFPEVSKRWLGIYSYSSIIPYYLLFTTNQCSSYLPQSDGDWNNLNGDAYYNAIQNDTLSSPYGTPQEDSTFLYGSYLINNITFSVPVSGGYEYIYKILTKFVPLSRTPNT